MFIKEDEFNTEKEYQNALDRDFENREDKDFKDEFMTVIELIEDELNNGQFKEAIRLLKYNWTDEYYDMSLLDEKDKENILSLLYEAHNLINDAAAKLYRVNNGIDDKTFVG